jgi:hypothetical protein
MVIPGCWSADACCCCCTDDDDDENDAVAWHSLHSNAMVNVSSPDEQPMHHTFPGRVRLLPLPPATGWRSRASLAMLDSTVGTMTLATTSHTLLSR